MWQSGKSDSSSKEKQNPQPVHTGWRFFLSTILDELQPPQMLQQNSVKHRGLVEVREVACFGDQFEL